MKAGSMLLGAALLAAMPVQAATEFEGSIPVELAEIFLGLAPGAQAIYSDLPDDFPLNEAPEGFTVLGSIDQQYSQTVHLRTSLAEEQALDILGERLEAQGWLAMPSPLRDPPTGGFSDPRAPERPRQWCHDAQGRLQISSRPAEEGRILTLASFGDPRVPIVQPSCAEQLEQRSGRFERPPMGGPLVSYLPRLVLPSAAELGNRAPGQTGSVSNSRDGAEAETEMSIDWDIQRVYDYFAASIAEQGWAPQDDWLSASAAGGSWTRRAEGASLLGIFSVLERAPGDYVLQFRLFSRRPELVEGE